MNTCSQHSDIAHEQTLLNTLIVILSLLTSHRTFGSKHLAQKSNLSLTIPGVFYFETSDTKQFQQKLSAIDGVHDEGCTPEHPIANPSCKFYTRGPTLANIFSVKAIPLEALDIIYANSHD